MLLKWLAHPLTAGLAADDPNTTILRREILKEKQFLRNIYEEWYQAMAQALPPVDGPVLELGTGAGFLDRFIPGLVTSDVLAIPGLSLVLDGGRLPFRAGSLRAIVMIDVLHHLPEVRLFLREASRCVKPGGAVIMIEPWVSPWSRLIYGRLHHEPFRPYAETWEFPSSGPLSGANEALAWIVFHRDRHLFELEFPMWNIRTVRPDMPLSYLLSGGVSMRSLAPGWVYSPVRLVEKRLGSWMHAAAMFAFIALDRTQ